MAMIGSLRDRLARRGPEPDVPAPDVEADVASALGPEVEFAAYAEDCRIFGFWRHAAERLSDALNDHVEYLLHDVLVAALEDGRGTELRQLTLRRDELIAVRAAGPRGNAARRSRVRPSPITLKAGPYTIHGYVHGPPGADPLLQIRRRRPMVPLTEAWIEYEVGTMLHRARVGVIIVNHDTVDWVRLSKDDEVRLAELPAESAIDPRAKDMTGHIMWQS
jgi:hypothetical protein